MTFNSLTEACKKAAAFCKSKGVELPKLAVQFAFSSPNCHTTLVGTSVPEELHKNVQWWQEWKTKGKRTFFLFSN